MITTDPVADLLTRMRNAVRARHATCDVQASSLKESVLAILQQEGYVAGFARQADGAKRVLRIQLKYGPDGMAAIQGLRRMSRPGRRLYSAADRVPRVLGGLGTCVLSTSRGVITDTTARKLGIGGELLCQVW